MPQATSAALAAQLLGHDTRASEAAIRAERKLRLEQALNQMDPLDSEVLAPAPLRAALEFRVCPGAGPERNDRDEALHPCAEEAQRIPQGASRAAIPRPGYEPMTASIPAPYPMRWVTDPRVVPERGSATGNGPRSRNMPIATPTTPPRSSTCFHLWSRWNRPARLAT